MADFLSSYQQGLALAPAINASIQKQAADNYLVSRFGPAAGDPTTARQAEAFQQATQMDPLLVRQQQLINTGTDQRNNYLAKYYPLNLQQTQLTNEGMGIRNDYNRQMDPLLVQQQGQTNAGNDIKLSVARASQNRQAFGQILGSMQDGLSQPGADPGAVFDAAVPTIANLMGNAPGAAQMLQRYRAAFIADPMGTLQRLRNQVASAEYYGMTPTERANLNYDTARANYYNAGGAAGIKAAGKVGTTGQTPAEVQQNAQAVQAREHLLGGQIDDAISAAKNLWNSNLVNRAEGSLDVGAQGRYMAKVEPIKHQLSLIDLMGLAASGLKFGRITVAEFQAASSAYANLDNPNLSKKDHIDDLNKLKTILPKLLAPVNSKADGTPSGTQSTSGQMELPPGITASSPRGLRNNNPGNISAGKFTEGLPGYVGSDGRFAQFQNPTQGLLAVDHLLQSYGQRGLNTVSGVISRWAPSNENDTTAYINAVAQKLGVDPNTPLNMQDPRVRAALTSAIVTHENGKNPYGDAYIAQVIGGQQMPTDAVQPGPGMTTDGVMHGQLIGNTGMTSDAIYTAAQNAIASGKDPAAVRQRLQEMGLDPSQLGG